jgi:hypothetical protein
LADNLAVTAGSGSTIGMDEVTDGTLGVVKVGFGKIMDGTLDGTDKLKISAQNAAQVAGDAAHDAVDAGNPVKIGGKARSSAPADVSLTGDRVDAYFDMKGRLKVDGSDVTQPISGTVTANLAAGTNNIGDVDVLSVPAPLSTTGGGTEATALRVTVASDSTGVLSVDDNGGSLTVDGTVTETNSGSILTAVQLIDDAIITDNAQFTDGTTKVNMQGYIFDEVAGTALTENDAAAARINANRAQIGVIEDPTTRGRYMTVSSGGAAFGVGALAHDAADAAANNPQKVGFRATTSNQTRVATDDVVNGIADTAGRQITNLGQVRDLRSKQTTTISASTSETTIGTAVASTFLDLVALVVSNTSASTNTRIDFRDTTAGTILFSLQSPANTVVGFQLAGSSIPQTTVNTNWTAQCSVSTTDVRVLAVFERNV